MVSRVYISSRNHHAEAFELDIAVKSGEKPRHFSIIGPRDGTIYSAELTGDQAHALAQALLGPRFQIVEREMSNPIKIGRFTPWVLDTKTGKIRHIRRDEYNQCHNALMNPHRQRMPDSVLQPLFDAKWNLMGDVIHEYSDRADVSIKREYGADGNLVDQLTLAFPVALFSVDVGEMVVK